jgi:hypothetical protein
MSSPRNPLRGADNAHAEASSHAGASTKRPYRAPELRKLGAVAELTYTGGGSPSPYFDGTGYPS